MMTGNQLRQLFLNYFSRNDHAVLRSSPLIPANDPSLMFTNAGMVQFKGVFTGEETLPHSRATTSQKCLRVSGKHNDFENVGRTARHHTFFEMLGNFSFGDYFKAEAIRYGWEFLTKEAGLDPARLWVTVFREDQEAHDLWRGEIGVAEDRIVRMDEKDNFWAMGETGPCGPCSEIIFDQGPEACPHGGGCDIYSDCDRFLEVWNLVFMQFNRDQTGKMTPLPKPSIDTGMGLERLAALVQGKMNNYDSDLFAEIIGHASEIAQIPYNQAPESDVSLRVVADHVRAMTFLIGDAVLPSNEHRGYVLRRIMRRAARHGVLLGIEEPFLYKVSGTVVDVMRQAYPELAERRNYIAKVIQNEEERFLRTVQNGMKLLSQEMDRLEGEKDNVIPGEIAFKLYDTFGFPLDLTEDIGRDRGFTLDQEGFDRAMARQRETAAAAWKGTGAGEASPGLRELASRGVRTEYMGYTDLKVESEILGIIAGGELVPEAGEGTEVEVVCATTPFYAEMGGQVGDTGRILGADGIVEVADAQAPVPDIVVHRGRVIKGTIRTGSRVSLMVDAMRRNAIRRNHTATHLLQNALRTVLGQDVSQAGSLVAPTRLRFDFTHYSAPDQRELERIERIVNEKILEDREVAHEYKDLEQAVADGAIALFGEKYADTVRMITVDGVSKELCGGTHVDRTGEIGLFRILSEGSVAAGVRRIEAVTGEAALDHAIRTENTIKDAAALLKTTPEELPERIERLLAEHKRLERELSTYRDRLASQKAGSLLDGVREIGGVRFLAVRTESDDPRSLRDFAVKLREQIASGVVVAGSAVNKRALLICMVSDDLTDRFSASEIIREIAPLIGGGGGGKADMAQAGGSNPDGMDKALTRFYEFVESLASSG